MRYQTDKNLWVRQQQVLVSQNMEPALWVTGNKHTPLENSLAISGNAEYVSMCSLTQQLHS
jgi:hypothetical protein